MAMPNLPMEGGCRCGRVRLRISAPPLLTMACHCRGCQKMSSSAYSLSVAIPSDCFAVIDGEPVIGGLHGELRHFFCGHCMSWMFTRADVMAGFVNLRPTMLDETGWFTPFVETYTCEKLGFADTGARHSYERFPPFEDYGRLAQEFAALEDARPSGA
ncbi:GFA family protein [Ensifer soli]|uniref:GFA family protein n=1 Tax=Ciceribacter sp. sgz301302 TaxID=3342379 RepID=UPI0035B70968